MAAVLGAEWKLERVRDGKRRADARRGSLRAYG